MIDDTTLQRIKEALERTGYNVTPAVTTPTDRQGLTEDQCILLNCVVDLVQGFEEAESVAWHNFDVCQKIDNWLVENGLMAEPSKSGDAADTIINSFKAILAERDSSLEQHVPNIREELQNWRGVASYFLKIGRIYVWNTTQFINRHLLKTYPLIEDCARCRDCGRNVHDFRVPDKLWQEVIGSHGGVWCYDCFSNRADEKLGFGWRLRLHDHWEKDGPLKEGDPCPCCNGQKSCPLCGASCFVCAGLGECDGYIADTPVEKEDPWDCYCGKEGG